MFAQAKIAARYTGRNRSLAMFKFTIRELLLLTVIVGLAVGWYLDHTRAARTQKDLTELTAQWNSLVAHLKYSGVTVEPGAEMIHWKGNTFPMDFKAPVDPAPGEAARARSRPWQK
jgi:hypothetical protein